MNKKTAWILAILVILLIVWGLASKGSTPAPAGQSATTAEPIKIGLIAPLTGDVASVGTVVKDATELAVDEVNSAGGINGRQIQLISEDGKCNPETANNAGNKLISIDKVSAIIGGSCSGETAGFAPAAMANKILVISNCSSAPSLSKTGKYFFRDYPSDAFQGKYAAEYLYNTIGAKKVAILYSITDWGTGLKDAFSKRFTELGGQVVFDEGTPQDNRDYKTQLSKINSLKPDYIYSPMYSEGTIAMIGQAKSLGIKIKFMGGDAWDDSKMAATVSGQADMIYMIPKTIDNAEFTSKLIAKYPDAKMSTCVPQAYDAIKIYAEAATKVGTDPDKMQEELRATVYQGVSGKIDFDENGDINVADYIVKKIANGTSVEVK